MFLTNAIIFQFPVLYGLVVGVFASKTIGDRLILKSYSILPVMFVARMTRGLFLEFKPPKVTRVKLSKMLFRSFMFMFTSSDK